MQVAMLGMQTPALSFHADIQAMMATADHTNLQPSMPTMHTQIHQPPPPPPSQPVHTPNICSAFASNGFCRYGDACRFSHNITATVRQVHSQLQEHEQQQQQQQQQPNYHLAGGPPAGQRSQQQHAELDEEFVTPKMSHTEELALFGAPRSQQPPEVRHKVQPLSPTPRIHSTQQPPIGGGDTPLTNVEQRLQDLVRRMTDAMIQQTEKFEAKEVEMTAAAKKDKQDLSFVMGKLRDSEQTMHVFREQIDTLKKDLVDALSVTDMAKESKQALIESQQALLIQLEQQAVNHQTQISDIVCSHDGVMQREATRHVQNLQNQMEIIEEGSKKNFVEMAGALQGSLKLLESRDLEIAALKKQMAQLEAKDLPS